LLIRYTPSPESRPQCSDDGVKVTVHIVLVLVVVVVVVAAAAAVVTVAVAVAVAAAVVVVGGVVGDEEEEEGKSRHPFGHPDDSPNCIKHWPCAVKTHFLGQHLRPGRSYIYSTF
jgi:hypothetical protein